MALWGVPGEGVGFASAGVTSSGGCCAVGPGEREGQSRGLRPGGRAGRGAPPLGAGWVRRAAGGRALG